MFRKLLIMLGLIVPLAANADQAATEKYQVTTPSGLEYTDVVVGTGPSPKTGQR